jgi:hypothetical protein
MSILKKLFGKKDPKIESYADFWAWFQSHEKTFHRVVKNEDDIEENFFQSLSPALDALGHDFYFVTGMVDPDTVKLVISAEGNVKTFVFVEELIAAAPAIPGWQFTAHKPVMEIEDANIHMAGYVFNKDNLQFYPVEYADRPDEIELVVVHPEWNEENKDVIGNGVYLFLDNYLGELNFATIVDHVAVEGPDGSHENLIPLVKLKDYLLWREKEFIEKYEGVRHDTAEDSYSTVEATSKNDNPVMGVFNVDLLQWDRKASHPWLLRVEMTYPAPDEYGMPDDETYAVLDDVEDAFNTMLKDSEGYLNVGRLTADGVREVYFACREFRKPSQVVYQVGKQYADKLDIQYSIEKDKYWHALDWLNES